jgi:hypothetical protein
MRKMIALILVILFIGVAMAGCTSTTSPKKNKPPVATFTVTPGTEVTHNQLLTFDASASTDLDKKDVSILTYEWDFKDGTEVAKGTKKIVPHAFATDGKYQVWLYVYDAKTMTPFSKNITVTNQPPKIVNFYPPDNASVMETVSQEFVANATDIPNNDTLIYQWSVDNQDIQGENSKTYNYVPTYDDAETSPHNVSVRINDGKGGIIYKTWAVNITNKNQPPIINTYSPITDDVTLAEMATQTFSVTASDPDENILTYKWYLDSKVFTGQSAASFSYQPDYNVSGFHVLKVIVDDGQGGTVNRSWNVTVTNTNRVPIITATNPASTVVTLNETASKKFQITAMDPDADVLTYGWTLDSNDISGATGNNYTYVPTLQDAGDHTLVVSVSDGKGGSDSAQWQVTVGNLNQPPTITDYSPKTNPTVAENVLQNFTVTGSDPDGDALTYQWSLNGTNLTGQTASTYQFLPDYTMGNPSQKTHTVKVYVKDTTTGIVERSWTVTVTNVDRAPIAAASVNMSKPGIGLDVKLDASASTDPDGDALSYIWLFGDGTPNQGGKTVTHTYLKPGAFNATVTVSDGTLSSQAQVTVTVNITQSWMSGPLGLVSPVVVDDVDGDGTKEILFGGVESDIGDVLTGFLYIYDATNFNQEFKSGDIGRVNDIKVANVDGDAAKEIIVATFKSTTAVGAGGTYTGHVYIFGGASPHTQEFSSTESGNYNCIGIGDLDSDGTKEIVAPRADSFFPSAGGVNYYGNISVYGYSGAAYVKEWQTTNFDGFGRTLDIGDLDGDGAVEGVVGTLDNFDIATTSLKGRVVTVAYNNPSYVIQNTNNQVGQVNDLVIADVDKDNANEVVLGDINKTTATHNQGYLEVLSKTLTYEWMSPDYGSVTCIAVGDIDGDLINETAFGVDYNHTEDKVNNAILYPEGYLYIINGQSHAVKFKSAQIGAVISLAVGNIDKSVTMEIAVGTWNKQDASMNYEGYLYVFSYSSVDTKFLQLWKSGKMGQIGMNSIVIADTDSDGYMDIVMGTSESAGAMISGKVYIYSNKSMA